MSGQTSNDPYPAATEEIKMIKVSVFYPTQNGSKFDMDYYCKSHIPMVQQKLGAACKGVAVEHRPLRYRTRVTARLCCNGASLFRFGRSI